VRAGIFQAAVEGEVVVAAAEEDDNNVDWHCGWAWK
jgi:hypothetical protein